MNRGIVYAIGAYFLWGLFPLYWKLIHNIPALEIIAHRILWSFIFVLLVIWLKKDWRKLRPALQDRHITRTYLLTGVLLFANWLVYVWAVNAGHIVDASLGYFINPLVNVVLGVLFLREQLRLGQWIPVGIAALGVLYLTFSYGALPWIGLTLALTFGTYGLLKKTAPLNSLDGFTLETGFLFVPALIYLLVLALNGDGSFLRIPAYQTLLLLFSGVVTSLPLLLFGAAARRVPLSTMGFVQYIAPTLQFLIGVLVYGESFSSNQLVGFGLIWLALLIFSADSFRAHRRQPLAIPAD